MAKRLEDNVLDGSLDAWGLITEMHLCSAEPTSYAEVDTFSLGSVAVAPGDFTKANGDTSGRKNTLAAKNGVSVTTSGTATHVAHRTVTGSVFRGATTCTSQVLTAGNTANIPAHKYEQGDPS
ncbi:MAG: hypothetical protein AAGA99_08955 [Actinomycetota bacterium]